MTAAIAKCDVPILLQAYPDRLDEMDFEHRRDAFCGKLALTNVLHQMKKPYTTFLPFTVHPSSEEFARQLKKFAGICRIVKNMKAMRMGVMGARTTAFKSVCYAVLCGHRRNRGCSHSRGILRHPRCTGNG